MLSLSLKYNYVMLKCNFFINQKSVYKAEGCEGGGDSTSRGDAIRSRCTQCETRFDRRACAINSTLNDPVPTASGLKDVTSQSLVPLLPLCSEIEHFAVTRCSLTTAFYATCRAIRPPAVSPPYLLSLGVCKSDKNSN